MAIIPAEVLRNSILQNTVLNVSGFGTGASGGGGGGTAYGQFYVDSNAVAQVLTNQNQYYVINPGWTAGISNGFNPDVSNSRLICNVPGIYQILVSVDYIGPVNQTVKFSVFINGVVNNVLTAHTVPRGANQIVFTAIGALIQLAAGDILDLRAESTTAAGVSITVVHANVGANLIAQS